MPADIPPELKPVFYVMAKIKIEHTVIKIGKPEPAIPDFKTIEDKQYKVVGVERGYNGNDFVNSQYTLAVKLELV